MNTPTQHIFLKINRSYQRIQLDDILFIQSNENYISFYLENNILTAKNTMLWCEKQLPDNQFIRVHKSYIININKVESIDKHNICISDNSIPMSRSKKVQIVQFLMHA